MRTTGHKKGDEMKTLNDEKLWQAVSSTSAIAAGVLARKSLQAGWEKAKKEEPPLNPESRDVSWKDAIIWTIATGVTVGLARLIARRLAAQSFEKWHGHVPIKETSR